jgi:CRISPR system Cascade subunit CasE
MQPDPQLHIRTDQHPRYLSRLILNPRSPRVRRDLADCHQLHRTVMTAFPDLAPLGAIGAAPDAAPGTGFHLSLDRPSAALAATPDARARLGVLYRLDAHPRTGQAILLVQSAAAPDWSRLPHDYLLPVQDDQTNPAIKSVADAYAAIRAGDELLFRLRANPTKRLPPSTGPDGVRRDGKRVELRTEEDQLTWLVRKGVEAGFALLDATVRSGLPDVRPGYRPPDAPDARAHSVGKVHGRRSDPSPSSGGAATRRTMTFGDVLFEGRLRVLDPDAFRRALALGIGPGKAYGFGLLSVAPAR